MAHRFEKHELRESTQVGFAHTQKVRFQDVDAAGIIFFVRMLEYMHDAYVGFLEQCGHPLPEQLQSGSLVAPITHAEADFFSPTTFGDSLEVQIVLCHVRESDATLGYRVVRTATDDLIAVGQTVHVFVDRESFERSPIPEPLSKAFRALNGA